MKKIWVVEAMHNGRWLLDSSFETKGEAKEQIDHFVKFGSVRKNFRIRKFVPVDYVEPTT